ncbi:MAG: dockerin type I repeat-containing protein [Clostridia bacterium]|nr:dockerin type I repeat-containing protein [Clostridia bacterium]
MKRTIAVFLTLLLLATLLPASAAEQAVSTAVDEELTENEFEPWIEAERALSASASEAFPQTQLPTVEFKEPTTPTEIWDGTIATSYAGGTGTATDPYLISNGAELAYLAQQVNTGSDYSYGKYFKLTAHICLNDTTNWQNWGTEDSEGNIIAPANEWTAIGCYYDSSANYTKTFQGTFDGDGYSVSGIYINKTSTDNPNYQGLFGYCYGATISNIAVNESYIKGDYYVGGVVGYNDATSHSSEASTTTVENCYNTGTISGDSNVGGVVGYSNAFSYSSGISNATIKNCYNTGKVSAKYGSGGVVGRSIATSFSSGLATATVTNCYNTGAVNSTENVVGGVVGYNDAGAPSHGTAIATVENCYNTGAIGGSRVGGVVGQNGAYTDSGLATATVTVKNCYNTGTVSGGWYVGGVVGYNDAYSAYSYSAKASTATVENCYNTGTISGSWYIGGVVGYNRAYSYSSEIATSTVENCYNTGAISGPNRVGGVVGYNYAYLSSPSTGISTATVKNCYYLNTCGATVGATNHGGNGTETIENVIALTDAQLRVRGSYVGFDFTTVWTMEGSADYPYAELIGMPHLEEPTPATPTPTPGGPTPTPPAGGYLYGDADCDGDVDSADAAAILRYVVKLPNSDLSQLGKVQGDVAAAFDGEPDSSDAAAILRFVVKIIDSLGP